MKYFLLFSFLLMALNSNGQRSPTIQLQAPYFEHLEKNDIPIIDNSLIYIGDNLSKDLFYYALVPEDSIQGTLILLPPTGQTVEAVFNHNIKLIELAFENRLLLIIPSINFNLCLDEKAMDFLNTTFKDMLKRYTPPEDKIAIGGFSLGGMNAIRYTEMAHEEGMSTVIKPAVVYGVDPPLDFTRLYYSFQRTIEKNFSAPAIQEAKVYVNKLERQFGGTPEENPDEYLKHSMYSRSAKDGGNAKTLTNIPIRIYSDPDIDWHLKNRHTDYYDMNALDQTAMINQLNLMGNEQAEFITALGKGYRLDGRRHPHSWSIVEPTECIAWLLECLNK